MSAIVQDQRTLNGMERQGFIIRNGHNQTERHWTGAMVPVITVREGPKLERWYQEFTYRGKQYRIQYFDGCFKPFVVGVGEAVPAFV